MTDDAKLPPLPYPQIPGNDYTAGDMQAYALAAIEQAVLQSEQVQSWKRDAERLDWLADPKNRIGNVQLPTVCVERNPHSLRDAIDDAMENKS